MSLSRKDSILFSPLQIGPMTVPNRFMRSAVCLFQSDETGFPKKKELNEMIKTAKGKTGLIIPGFLYPLKSGRTFIGMTGVPDKAHIEAWRSTIEEIHKYGSKIVFQVCDGGIACQPNSVNNDVRGVSPLKPGQREMTIQEIDELIQAYKRIAHDLEEVGADGIQLHMCHGYLLSTFLSPAFNKRKDKYGQTHKNRMRLPIEITRAVKESVSENFAILVKMNGHDCLPDHNIKQEGTVPSLAAETVKNLRKAGVHFFEISNGMLNPMTMSRSELRYTKNVERKNDPIYKGMLSLAVPERYPYFEGYNVPYAEFIKEQNPGIKVAAPGGLRHFDQIEKMVKEGRIDMASFGRPYIRDPMLAKRFFDSEINEVGCISCNQCLGQGGPVHCLYPTI